MKISLKEALYIVFSLIRDIISNAFMPLITTGIKMSVISGVLWAITNFAPHTIESIKGFNFISCLVAVVCVRLLLFRYDDFDDQPAAEVPTTPDYLNDEEPPVAPGKELEPQLLQEQIQPPSNIRSKLETDESTRE